MLFDLLAAVRILRDLNELCDSAKFVRLPLNRPSALFDQHTIT